ncbi:MAG TPA: hypothetical protein VFJ85_04180 [Acidimicrobiales bacterium]|nr:hypothetical protein [Acidimicrobiales bacterium]
MRKRGRLLFAALAAWAATVGVLASPAAAGQAHRPSAVIAVWTAPPARNLDPQPRGEPHDRILRTLEADGLAPALLSASQGTYARIQALLDISQGSRQPTSLFEPHQPPPVTLRPEGGGAVLDGWAAFGRRAHDVSVTLRPGLLAESVPGGAAFVGVEGTDDVAVVAADRSGRVARLSLGDASTLARRTAEALAGSRLVVVALPDGPDGEQALADLVRERAAGDLLVVANLPPTPPAGPAARAPARFYALTAFGVAGGPAGGSVTSSTTRQAGLVSTIDIAPTVLRHLGQPRPAVMRGDPIRRAGGRSAGGLEAQRRRWSDARSGRQASSLTSTILCGMLLLMVLGAVRGAASAWRPALRILGLAMLWWPTVVLAAAVVAPATRGQEVGLIAAACLAAGLLTDALLAWPRGPILPAAAAMAAYTADLATGGHLLTRSVLGPSIVSGGRFFGVSNELEPLLPVLALVGLAAIPWRRPGGRRLAALYAGAGVALGVVLGSGRMGADVGGVVTVAAAFTAATLVVRRRPLTRRAMGVALALPVLGLLALAAIDLGLGGGAHLARDLSRSQGLGDLSELVIRRYQLIATTFTNAATPLWMGAALVAVAFAVRNRSVLYASVHTTPWTAALVGGLAGGIVGALTNDSGPVLLTNTIIALAAATAYAQGRAPATVTGDRLPDPQQSLDIYAHPPDADVQRPVAGQVTA